jgi:ABC-2 type transport system ATP-binding protein
VTAVRQSPEAVINARQLTKRFGTLTAVDGLDLEVRRNEIFGYLGPNGAGKTTTIRLCLDFLRATAGELRILGGTGRDPAIRRRIGYLPGDLRHRIRVFCGCR